MLQCDWHAAPGTDVCGWEHKAAALCRPPSPHLARVSLLCPGASRRTCLCLSWVAIWQEAHALHTSFHGQAVWLLNSVLHRLPKPLEVKNAL